MLPFFNVV